MVAARRSALARVEAEAAAWIARLQSPDRGAATDAGLRQWLDADAVHREAFERATEIWGIIPGAARHLGGGPVARGPSVSRRALLPRAHHWALAASLVLLAGGGAAWWMLDQPAVYTTRVGEQKVATLSDGTRIALNTATRLSVEYDDKTRRVWLDHGEAMFEVAHNPHRPFIVTAGDRTVRAVGTSFTVRRTGDGVAVTLIEGKVLVTPTKTSIGPRADRPTMLSSGERLTASQDAPTLIDQPSIEAVTAWRHGQAVFADTPLSAAVAELNRYGGPHIAISDPRLASLSVSGVFATNDTAEFASAIAELHGLRVEQQSDGGLRIVR